MRERRTGCQLHHRRTRLLAQTEPERSDTASSRSFTLAKAGLVAICYEWVPFSASSNLYLSVDGLEVHRHMAGQEGTGSHVYTRYVFLQPCRTPLGFSQAETAAGCSA